MRFEHLTTLPFVLCLLGACAGAAGPEAPDASPESLLIDGTLSSTFHTQADDCRPLGYPVTAFLTSAFGASALVEEDASPVSDGECQHEQMIAAEAEAWARVSYETICFGAGDADVCGAVEARLCSLRLLLEWSSERSDPVRSQTPTPLVSIEVPPQSAQARAELQRVAQTMAEALIDEGSAVLEQRENGARDCPDEDGGTLQAMLLEGVGARQSLDQLRAE